VLVAREWAALADFDHIANLGGVTLIVYKKLLGELLELLVLWVLHVTLDGHRDGVLHF